MKCISLNCVLPSDRTFDILKIGVSTHSWMYVRKKNFHVSCTWYKSLVPGEEIRLLEIVQISLSAVILKKAKMFKKNAERILKSSEIKRNWKGECLNLRPLNLRPLNLQLVSPYPMTIWRSQPSFLDLKIPTANQEG